MTKKKGEFTTLVCEPMARIQRKKGNLQFCVISELGW